MTKPSAGTRQSPPPAPPAVRLRNQHTARGGRSSTGLPRDRCRRNASLVIDQSSVLQPNRMPPTAAVAIAADPDGAVRRCGVDVVVLAEGTSTGDGRADETDARREHRRHADATITVMTGTDPTVPSAAAVSSRRPPRSTRGKLRCRCRPSPRRPSPEWSSRSSVVRRSCRTRWSVRAITVETVPRTAPMRRPTRTSANGTTVRGTQQLIVLFNRFGNDRDRRHLVPHRHRGDGAGPDAGCRRPRRSRVSVPVHDAVERQVLDAAHVHARAGRVVAERTQLFDGTVSDNVPVRKGITLTLGAVAPQRTWEARVR